MKINLNFMYKNYSDIW